jgi:hypothetical protein
MRKARPEETRFGTVDCTDRDDRSSDAGYGQGEPAL